MTQLKGIELSGRFYGEVVQPWLRREYPGLRHAAALLGYGSELLGFDDVMSQDHNWGPRVWLYVSPADFGAAAETIVARFAAAAPQSFLGVPTGFYGRPHLSQNAEGCCGCAAHGLEVRTLDHTLAATLGLAPGGADGRYAPYPKWFGAAFARLASAGELGPPLARAVAAGGWRDREAALANAYLRAAELCRSHAPPVDFSPTIGPYFGRPFKVINAEEISAAFASQIEDPALKPLPVIGSLDQVTDSTPVIEAPGRAQASMRALLASDRSV